MLLFICCYLLTFETSTSNTIRVSNGLDPYQDVHSDGPDLGPNCLQRLSADDKVAASKERINQYW